MIEIKLDDLLHKYNITADKLAKETKLSKNTISKLRNGKGVNVGFQTLNLVCKYFNCNIEDLLQYIND